MVRVRVRVRLGGVPPYSTWQDMCANWCCFDGNNSVKSAAHGKGMHSTECQSIILRSCLVFGVLPSNSRVTVCRALSF